MNITIKDVAKAAGVSYSTVSKALRNSSLVNRQTKDHIINIANKLGYLPNETARSLVSKSSNTIGVIWPTIERLALSKLITKINKRLKAYGYTPLISIDDVESSLQIFTRYRVDAILAFEDDKIKEYQPSNIPIVTYGITKNDENSMYPIIDVNRQEAIFKAVHCLYQMGHRKICFIGARENDYMQGEKVKGFKQAFKKLNIPSMNNQIIYVQELDQYDGYIAARELLERKKEKPTAIISGTHELTRGILNTFHEKNISIPQDISIISYDIIPTLDHSKVPVTTVGVSLEKIAEKITTVLMYVIDNIVVEKKILLEPELIITNSCRIFK